MLKLTGRARRAVAITVAALVLAGAIAGAATSLTGRTDRAPAPSPTPSAAFTVQAPQDGSLTVGTVTVPQLAGSCPEAGSCRYAPVGEGELPTVTVAADTAAVPVRAAQSVALTISAFNLADPQKPVTVGYADGHLLLDGVPKGRYQVSVTGERGGIWQFQLHVTKPAKK